jgi:hypothetical protein
MIENIVDYCAIALTILFAVAIYYLIIVVAVKNGLSLFVDSVSAKSQPDIETVEDFQSEITPPITEEESVKILRNMRGEQ